MSIAMPRTNLETFKTTLPKDLWNHLARARGAHLNSLEVFPLYAAAILAGNVAKLPAEDLSSVAWSFFTARVVYMGLYLGVKNDVLAYVSIDDCCPNDAGTLADSCAGKDWSICVEYRYPYHGAMASRKCHDRGCLSLECSQFR